MGPFGEVHRRPISQGHRATTRDRCRSGFPRIAKLIDSPTAFVGIVRSISAGPTSGRAPRRPDSGGAPLIAHKIFCRERTCYRARASKMGPVPNVAVPLWPSVFARQCFFSLTLTVMTSALGAELHQSSMMSPLPCRHGLPRWAIRLVSTGKSLDARGEPISMRLSQVLNRVEPRDPTSRERNIQPQSANTTGTPIARSRLVAEVPALRLHDPSYRRAHALTTDAPPSVARIVAGLSIRSGVSGLMFLDKLS